MPTSFADFRPVAVRAKIAARLWVASTKTLLLGMLLFFIALGTLLGGLTLWADHQNLLAQAEANARNLSRLLEEHARRTIQASDHVVRRVADLVDAEAPGRLGGSHTHWEKIRALSLTLPEAGSLRVIDADGNVILCSTGFPAPARAATDPRLLQEIRDSRGEEVVVGPLARSPLTGGYAFTVSHAIADRNGRFAGAVVAEIEAQYFANIHDHVNLGPNSVLVLLRTDGTLVLRQPMENRFLESTVAGTELFRLHLRRSSIGTFQGVSPYDGAERIVAYRRIPGLPLVAVTAIATGDALREWRRLAARYVLFGAITLGMLLGLSVLALRSIRREHAGWTAVQGAIDTLREANETLEQRVRERTLELSAANARLESALDQKELLLKEVNHRVKNSLQLISSLLMLQGNTTTVTEVRRHLTEACGRVATVAQVHQRLYQTVQFETVEFGALLRGLCTDLESSLTDGPAGHAVTVSADAADLPIDHAIPLALIANELVTNALKYAYPAGGKGAVTVVFRHGDKDRRTLTVADRGVGLPVGFDPCRDGGLGMQMLAALTGQLDAGLEIDREPPGVRFTVTLPADHGSIHAPAV